MDVYVKVMEVTVESTEDENGRQRQRHRVKLSMKFVDQETGGDLDPDNVQMEQDLFRSGGNRSRNADEGGTGGANSMLGRNLASNIGMSSAIDPGNLILKGKQKGMSASFNGYALVGEEEGEAANQNDSAVGNNGGLGEPPKEAIVRPMGRGRGTTLPAWMTRKDDEDKLGSVDKNSTKDDWSDDGSNQGRKSHKHRKKERQKHHKRSKKHRHKDSRRRDRSRSSSRSRSRSRDKKRSHKRSHKSRHRYSRSRSPSRDGRYEDRSRSRSRSRGGDYKSSKSEFASVEEAKAVIERLGRQKRER